MTGHAVVRSLALAVAALAATAAPAAAVPPPTTSTTVATAAAGVERPVAAHAGGFQYPEIWLLPLALGAGALGAARLLTADATPKRRLP